MRFVGGGEVIEVVTIGVGEMGLNVCSDMMDGFRRDSSFNDEIRNDGVHCSDMLDRNHRDLRNDDMIQNWCGKPFDLRCTFRFDFTCIFGLRIPEKRTDRRSVLVIEVPAM